ncbi:trypsin-like peptidase domain-containing protein [Azospirillum sp. TSO22-1]|uniref:trypsin-like peptidase domain-containing protein n=1 Tax=Azospirillum sp. TSO22-1 TaxID=716789 RepID=UPI000D65250F|nr:trypsin-like peptidase domain-containing protein [Azospirillum sp. TSO22-1]
MRIAVLALLLLAGCAGGDPPLGPAVQPVPQGTTETIRFNTLNLGQMRRGMEIGRYVWDIDCTWPYGRVFWTSGLGFRRENTFHERFAEIFEGAGFDVAGAVYTEGTDRRRARYVVTGELREVRLELCRRRGWWTGDDRGVSGVGTVKIDWTVFEPEAQRVALRTTTTGHARQDDGVPEGDRLLLEDAFSGAAEALAAEPAFRTAVGRGGGAQTPDGKRWRMVPPERRDPTPISGGAIAAEPIRAMASPRGGAGDGLVHVGAGVGVVVGTAEGAALVLAPLAVGDAVAVRVGGMAAEGMVAARDAGRGLMLVRVPARLAAMRLRGTPAEVSEPVMATGAGNDFATGMVAGLGDGILADLEGAAPRPGDPLLDATGTLLGVALPGRGEGGLSRFVPVGEALAALGVTAEHGNLDGGGLPPT